MFEEWLDDFDPPSHRKYDPPKPVLVDLAAALLTKPSGPFGRDKIPLRVKAGGLDLTGTYLGDCTPQRGSMTGRGSVMDRVWRWPVDGSSTIAPPQTKVSGNLKAGPPESGLSAASVDDREIGTPRQLANSTRSVVAPDVGK
ncbi:hypothetical protein [Nocardia sp. NPDC051570]|uniref:hypothetical protein n=1 Tax=Nocardia sp. NPDC051570 TaxID=3364324 RepID=UPI0037A0C8AE